MNSSEQRSRCLHEDAWSLGWLNIAPWRTNEYSVRKKSNYKALKGTPLGCGECTSILFKDWLMCSTISRTKRTERRCNWGYCRARIWSPSQTPLLMLPLRLEQEEMWKHIFDGHLSCNGSPSTSTVHKRVHNVLWIVKQYFFEVSRDFYAFIIF